MRASVWWTGLVVLLVGLVTARWLPLCALALAVGGLCGILNSMITARSIERLSWSRSAAPFVISSFFRLGLFGIVPVAFAAVGPWWSMVWYFGGFFLPTAVYAASIL